MSHLDFTTEPLEGVPDGLVVKLDGNIDAATALDFGNRLEDLQKQGTKHFVFDMERVTFVNSTGMGLLVRAADSTTNSGGSFVLIKIHPKVKIVFEMLGLDAFFKTYPSFKRAHDYIIELIGGPQPTGASAAPAAAATPAAPAPPVPAAPAPRRAAAAAPPPPAAPAPRGGTPLPASPAGAPAMSASVQSSASSGAVNPPQQGATRIIGSQGKAPSAFIMLPGRLPHYGIIYSFIQAACVGAQIVAKRMDPAGTDESHQRNMAELQSVNFVIADFTPDTAPGQPNNVVAHYATAARTQLQKQVICLIQGSKENLPADWRNLPTVPYHASQQGMQYLKYYLENGLKQLVARLQQQQAR